MTAAYEFWEMDSGNLMDSFESQDEARDALAEAIQRYGSGYADSIMLVCAHGTESTPLGSGQALGEQAMAEWLNRR